MINEAVLANHTAFGENMVQEAISKMSALNKIDNIEWHLIGPVSYTHLTLPTILLV